MSEVTEALEPRLQQGKQIPEARTGITRRKRWGFLADLKVGGSAEFDFETYEAMVDFRNSLGSTAHRYGKRLDREFTVRTMRGTEMILDENENETGEERELFVVGVWRVE